LIIQGEFLVSQNQKLIRKVRQGDFVGEVGLMKTGGKRTATVQSETTALVLEIPQNEFYSMLGQNILIGHQLELLANERLLADQRRQS
jgi:CRP-like cAMP-binding protein